MSMLLLNIFELSFFMYFVVWEIPCPMFDGIQCGLYHYRVRGPQIEKFIPGQRYPNCVFTYPTGLLQSHCKWQLHLIASTLVATVVYLVNTNWGSNLNIQVKIYHNSMLIYDDFYEYFSSILWNHMGIS